MGATPAPGAAEVIYHSERTRISRVKLPDGRVGIRKEALGDDATVRIRHEAGILRRLGTIDRVVRPVAGLPDEPTAIRLEECPGRTLASFGPDDRFDPARLPALAGALARILADVHRAGVMHRDLHPGNIVITDDGPVLLDFDLATTFAEIRPSFTHHSQIVGRLPYLAPEQTGRTGQPVDSRADLYGLGAILYGLAAGVPPLGDGDQLELVRDILTRDPDPAPLRAVSPGFADIVSRLLHKEPDRRYSSAEGLAYDLDQLVEFPERPLRIGERDFPSRLAPPAELVGRDTETRALRRALAAACDTAGRGILVAGAPGVGKSALIAQLKPMVTADGGWFISGKFDQFRPDAAASGVIGALSGLGRLLLAEGDTELAAHRDRIRAALGSNVGLLVRLLPEYGALLGAEHPVPPFEPTEAEARLRRTVVDLLRAVAAGGRPVVMVVDDLQWAPASSLGILDALLLEPDLRGLLVVGAYRDQEVDATHPLTGMLTRWDRLGVAPPTLRLTNLDPADLATLLAGMLRLPGAEATKLADAVAERTAGNPFDTVELVNALRSDGALILDVEGWRWDPATVRTYIGHGDVLELLQRRVDRLPEATRELLRLMACLGGEARLRLLALASDLSVEQLITGLTPALEDALLLMDIDEDPGIRFRHDRVHQAVHSRFTAPARSALHLTVARRLADRPAVRLVAAEQYLAVGELTDPAERRLAAELFAAAAAGATRASNHTTAERYLRAAIDHRVGVGDEIGIELLTARHSALYNLGRLDEADEVYAEIERSDPAPMDLVEAACTQICNLGNQFRPADAVTLGLDLLGKLGLAVDRDDITDEIGRQIDGYREWVMTASAVEDAARPELRDPRALAVARVIRRLVTPAYWTDLQVLLWLGIQARQLWTGHGPCAELVGVLAAGGCALIAARNDHAAGAAAARYAVDAGEARDYDVDTAQARYYNALFCVHWAEPVEEAVSETRLAREGLIRGGDLQTSGFSYYTALFAMIDSAETVDDVAAEVAAAVDFGTRTGNEAAVATSLAFRQFCRAMRGETDDPPGLGDEGYDVAEQAQANPRAASYLAILGAVAVALYDVEDEVLLAAGARARAARVPGIYGSVPLALVGALALARELGRAGPAEREALLTDFDERHAWFARRAEAVPANFGHLVTFLAAERAWALGEFRAAAEAFDGAARAVAERSRPWHRALIAERAGLFHLATGMELSGQRWLAESRGYFQRWGALGKVRALEQRHPFLRTIAASPADIVETVHSTSVRSDDIDMMAILRTSQALSSETDLDNLYACVVAQLTGVTGATRVDLLLPDDGPDGWALPADGTRRPAPLPLRQAADAGLLPLSAVRYVVRTREPLLVDDATADDRFARDPYLAGVDRCSLLLVPVTSHGTVSAIVILENRLSRGAFTTDRLGAVNLLAGQLSVSINNALLYRNLEAKVAERTTELQAANAQLAALSVTDQLTGLANRRRFDEALSAAWEEAIRLGDPIAVAMIDIDHFKLYNDHYGHQGGDDCLQRVATALNDSVRQRSDLACRYGGEEFALILPGSEAEQAAQAAERARTRVTDLEIPHAKAAAGIVTLSIGVAAARPALGDDVANLVKAADGALYEAKDAGRNRVRVG